MNQPVLGVTMGDTGNEYDATPPPPPEELLEGDGLGQAGRPPTAVREAMDWLAELVSADAIPASQVFAEADKKGIAKRTLYRAKGQLGIDDWNRGRVKVWGYGDGSTEGIED